MTVAEPVVAGGLSDELGPVDYLLHRGEANPRTRSGIMALELLDSTPNWERFRTRFENASRKVLRLRQKVVVPTLPTTHPRWVVDRVKPAGGWEVAASHRGSCPEPSGMPPLTVPGRW